MDIGWIRECMRAGRVVVSFTHTEKLRRRRIELATIQETIQAGEIIEAYPHDPRGPSCLILGHTASGRPIHVVCGTADIETLLIITAYEPDPAEWEPDRRTRKMETAP